MDAIYRDHEEVLAAIERVKRFLTDNFIEESCGEGDEVLGCVSCQAIGVRRNLDMLRRDIEDDAALRVPRYRAKPVSPSSQQPDPEALDPLQHSRP